jgi:transcriptional regulator with XRE-family HTH domain
LEQAGGSADSERQLIIEFGRRLREARKRAGLSQAEVAARLGIRQGYVSRVELGTENITLSACVRFAQAVGCLFSPEFTPPEPHDSASGFAEFGRHHQTDEPEPLLIFTARCLNNSDDGHR